jgi:hypothetical protein
MGSANQLTLANDDGPNGDFPGIGGLGRLL